MGRHKSTDKHLPPRLRKIGHGYYYRGFADGKEISKPLGNDYARALLQWRELEGLTDDGETVPRMLENALALMTPRLKPSTHREFTRALTRLKKAFEGFAPADVEPVHIAEYLEKRTDKHGIPATVAANREISFFSAAWELGRRRRWFNLPNPALGIRRNKEKKRKRIATAGEIKALLFLDGARRDNVIADMIELTLMIGLRQGDILYLTRSQFEDDGIRIKPRKTADSTELEQLFSWTPAMRLCIERAKARRRRVGSMYLFPVQHRKRAGQPYSSPSFYKQWRPYFTACGVSGLTWHDLRRTALKLHELAHGKAAAQKFGGHASVTTTEGYIEGIGAAVIPPNTF
jgi:integrase